MKLMLLLTLCCLWLNTAQAEKINLVWQHGQDASVDMSVLPPVTGVNVVSPCWYDIDNQYGHLRNKSVPNYVAAAQAKGYKVWPLITSSFNPEMFHQVLLDHHARRYVIEQLIEQSKKHQFDGINLDFENIRDEDKDNLTYFVKEISKACRKHGLTLSMDVTVPSGEPYWSNCFDRKALSEQVDYLMLMTYDQYTPSMHRSGPTAALDWVEAKLQRTVKEVPATKLVLGLPLYMRLWTQDSVTGKTTGKTLSMPQAQQLIAAQKLAPTYLKKEALNFYCYREGTILKSFWLEDQASIAAKVNLVNQYNLAGVASWRKGFETSDIWPVIAAAME